MNYINHVSNLKENDMTYAESMAEAKRHTDSLKHAEMMADAKRRGWDFERSASKGGLWILFYWDENSQTQYNCESNGFETRRQAFADALAKDFRHAGTDG